MGQGGSNHHGRQNARSETNMVRLQHVKREEHRCYGEMLEVGRNRF